MKDRKLFVCILVLFIMICFLAAPALAAQMSVEPLSSSPPIVEAIPTTVNNGSVEILKGICGDVDGFEGVTTNDCWLVFMNASKPQGDPRYALACC